MGKRLTLNMKFAKIIIFILFFTACIYPVKVLGFIADPDSSAKSMPFNIQHSYPDIKKDINPSASPNAAEGGQGSLSKSAAQSVSPGNKSTSSNYPAETPVLSWMILAALAIVMIIILALGRVLENGKRKKI
jgi:hypothetical protein